MFDPRLYREACGELHVSPEKIEEVISMSQQNKKHILRRPLRAGLVTAAALALTVVGVSAASPQVLDAITGHIAQVFQVGELRQDMITEEGTTVTTMEMPEARIEDRDGRAILLAMGEEIDITAPLEEDGRYEYRYEDEGSQLTILVEGSLENWTMTTSVGVPGEEPGVAVVTTREEQERGPGGAAYAMSGDLDALEGGRTSTGEADAAASARPAGVTPD